MSSVEVSLLINSSSSRIISSKSATVGSLTTGLTTSSLGLGLVVAVGLVLGLALGLFTLSRLPVVY